MDLVYSSRRPPPALPRKKVWEGMVGEGAAMDRASARYLSHVGKSPGSTQRSAPATKD